MLTLEVPKLKDIFTGDIAKNGNWVVANLETSISWPVKAQEVEYLGDNFWLLPVTHESYPAIAYDRGDEDQNAARSKILRFASAISWAEGSGVIVPYFTGGNLPRPMGREKSYGLTIADELELTYLPEPVDDRRRLALALMREGRGLNHPAYAFLSFYRVLECALPNGKQRAEWLAANLDNITHRQGREALEKLKVSGVADLAEHLYKSGRQAIAHAQAQPIINPDDASDYQRLQSELPIMLGLAEYAIEQILGIQTRHTIWREHLYELSGFKAILGDELVGKILAGFEPEAGEMVDLPCIDVELRKSEPFSGLTAMRPYQVAVKDKMVQLVYRSPDELVQFVCVLDFPEERLRFEWNRDVIGRDDGSATAATYAAELTRFIRDYIGNGELHIYDAETGGLISRIEAFLPTNYWANHEALDERIARWTQEAEMRAAKAGGDAEPQQPPEES